MDSEVQRTTQWEIHTVKRTFQIILLHCTSIAAFCYKWSVCTCIKKAKKLSKYGTVRTVVKVLNGPASGPKGLIFRYIWFHFRLNQSRQICRRIEQISKALKKQFFIEGPIHFSNLGQQ